MKGLKDTLANLARLRSRFDRLLSTAATPQQSAFAFKSSQLQAVEHFGSNPGNLRMFTHMPRDLPKAPALVVALHGCTQTAAGYDHGSGWSKLADADGFAVVFPEQQRANNPNTCFNWFLSADNSRGAGEALSIREMVDHMIARHGIDRRRVFIVGLSAGGAMAAAMLAAYPDIFAGGAVIAGLPYGAAGNVQEALQVMAQPRRLSPAEWGDLVRAASTHRGPWPKISLWHGSADSIVHPENMEEALRQWINVHGTPAAQHVERSTAEYAHRVWSTSDGKPVIEAITIRGMNHGVPIGTSGRDSYGNVGPFHFNVGVSSTHHIARFWGIASEAPAATHKAAPQILVHHDPETVRATPLRPAGATATAGDPGPHITAALKAAGLLDKRSAGANPLDPRPLDPRKIVQDTLRSMGLWKK